MDLYEYRMDYIQNVKIGSKVNQDFNRSEFVNTVMTELIEAEEISEFTPCFYEGLIGNRGKKVEIDGYNLDEYDGTFSIITCRYDGTSRPDSKLTKTEIEDLAERARRFVEGSLDGTVQKSIEESEMAYELAEFIYGSRENIDRYRIFVLSDLEKSDRIKSLDVGDIEGKGVLLKVWDIGNLHDLSLSKNGFDEITINMSDFGAEGIPCLRTYTNENGMGYDAYLCAIPGVLLAKFYEKYGSRLLESNVRSFLKLSTKTNKAIRGTILKEPEMFFAYNNGITATATGLELRKDGDSLKIVSITSLQIVNGGQTTVTLFTVGKSRDKPDMHKISVPMKISVIPDVEIAQEIVPMISRSANTQNKVSESDFFSNSPFHREMEKYSRRLRTPQIPGRAYSTRWYYERTRGQYQQDVNMRSGSEASKFKAENPKIQMFTKTDLAKFRNSYELKPHIVSKGAQYSLDEFAKSIDEEHLERYNETYFKESVALGILFRRVQDLVTAQPWYNGGYRAQTVTYTIAKLSQMIGDLGGELDLMKIWNAQSLSEPLEAQLVEIAEIVYSSITEDKEEENVGQWCKKQKCWTKIQSKPIDLHPGMRNCLVSKLHSKSVTRIATRDQKMRNDVRVGIEVVNYGAGGWDKAIEWGIEHDTLTRDEKSILGIGTRIGFGGKLPSDKQASTMMKILDRLREEGFKG